ncbi:MAG TPA: creatininase family protein [Mycobacteriales bacterium]|nr:creatininase family protein [Mycobacteriales bacterium]
MRFSELSGPEAAARLTADSVAVLPVGAIEQHGPHLPLSTDLTIAESFATALVERAAVDAWLLPSLQYTKSDEHAWSVGTLWLSWDTLMRVLVDLGTSLAKTPVRRLVFLNAHGGNSALLQVACRELRRRCGLRTFLMHPGGPPPAVEEMGLGIHGGRGETSMMLHLRPDLVRMDLAARAVPEHLVGYEHIGFGKSVSFGWLSDDFSTGGVLGDPRGASAEEGRTAFERALERGNAALEEIARFEPRG